MKVTDKIQALKRIAQGAAVNADRIKRKYIAALPTAPSSSPDQVVLSDEAIRMALLTKAQDVAMKSSDVDMTKVAALKQAIADGSYKPDYDKVAERILEEEAILSKL